MSAMEEDDSGGDERVDRDAEASDDAPVETTDLECSPVANPAATAPAPPSDDDDDGDDNDDDDDDDDDDGDGDGDDDDGDGDGAEAAAAAAARVPAAVATAHPPPAAPAAPVAASPLVDARAFAALAFEVHRRLDAVEGRLDRTLAEDGAALRVWLQEAVDAQCARLSGLERRERDLTPDGRGVTEDDGGALRGHRGVGLVLGDDTTHQGVTSGGEGPLGVDHQLTGGDGRVQDA